MTQSEIDIIVPALVKKLESLPDKTSISLSELVRKTFACQAEYVEGEGWRLTLDNGISFYDSEHFDLMEPFEKAVHEAGYKICSEKDDWGGRRTSLQYHVYLQVRQVLQEKIICHKKYKPDWTLQVIFNMVRGKKDVNFPNSVLVSLFFLNILSNYCRAK